MKSNNNKINDSSFALYIEIIPKIVPKRAENHDSITIMFSITNRNPVALPPVI